MAWPEPGWKPVQPFPFPDAKRSFTGPEASQGRVAVAYYLRPDGGFVGLAEFGPLTEGAPGQVHGGAILTVLDEALGAAAWQAGHPVLTARLNTEFRRPVPVGARLLVETRITAARHKLVIVEGELRSEDGAVHAGAEGRFAVLAERFRKL